MTGLTSYNLDGRYYTETEADSRFLNASGDTMTGDLTISGGGNGIKLNNSDIRSAQANPTWTGNPGAVGKIQYHSNRWYIVADQSSNRIVQFRRNDLDKSYIDNNGDLQGGKAAGWITARTLSLTGAVTGSVSWDGTGNASLSTSLYNGPNYIDQAIGNYGTVKVDDDRGVNWAGYAIRDDWVFMANGANEAGIYNDTDNEWAIKFIRNAETELYHNGYLKLETSADGIEMSGRIDMNNNDIHGCDQLIHHADTNTYMQFHNADEWRVVCGGTERLEVKNSSPHVYVTGDFAATGNVTAYYSDERLKTKTGNIENALDKVGSLEGFYYVENDLAKSCGFDNEQTQVALSAQQVQAVMPECVSLAPFDIAKNIDGDTGKKSKSGEDYLTIDYAKLVPLLVESIKELKAKVEALENGPSE